MPPSANILRERFIRAWERFYAEDEPGERISRAFDRLYDAYAEPGRHYHSRKHLDSILWFRDWAETAMATTGETALMSPTEQARFWGEVELALFYHDVVYDPRAKDNEQQSIDWFLKDANDFGIAPEVRDNVAHLIGLTAHHKQAASLQERVMADCDLSIFAASRENFAEYDRDIRREYAHVPSVAYKPARRAVLQSFLQQERVFKTIAFNTYYEQQARDNLASALNPSALARLLGIFRK